LQYQHNLYIAEKYIRLAVVAFQNREITENSYKIGPYSSSRSPKVIDLGVNRKPRCDFLLVINSNCYRFRDIDVFSQKWIVFPPLPRLTLPLGGNPLELLDKTYPAKTRGSGLPYGEKFIILTSTVFLWNTRLSDRQTDRWTDGRTVR